MAIASWRTQTPVGEIRSARLYVSRLKNQSEWWALLNHSTIKWSARPHAKVCVSTLLLLWWMQREHCPPHIAIPLVYREKCSQVATQISYTVIILEMTSIHCTTEPLSTIYQAILSNYFTCRCTKLLNVFHTYVALEVRIFQPSLEEWMYDTISLSLMKGWILWQKKTLSCSFPVDNKCLKPG